jgi:oligopeptide/dipeptide ABC transporter ATP-binding protein
MRGILTAYNWSFSYRAILLERMMAVTRDIEPLYNLRLVRHISHRVTVMYLGKVVEVGDTRALYRTPLHPYIQALLRAAPSLEPAAGGKNVSLTGELPSALSPPAGCRFIPAALKSRTAAALNGLC